MFALYCLHHTISAYSLSYFDVVIAHDTRGIAFHITISMFVNTVLVPSCKSMACEGETFGDLNKRWIHDIISMATVPCDRFYDIGYGYNVMLDFDVNLGDNDRRISKESYGETGIGSKDFHMCEFQQKNTYACNGDGDHMINAYQSSELGLSQFNISGSSSESDQSDGKGGITISF